MSTVFAAPKEIYYSKVGVVSSFANITDKSEGEYLQSISYSLENNMPAEKRIQAVCEAFLVIAKASVREPEKYDCSQFIASDRLYRDTIQYRLTDYEYQSVLKEALGWEIIRDELVLSDFKVSIKGNIATASLVESYTYLQTDGFDSDSFRRKMYKFELHHGADGWKIINVTTDDPWELEPGFYYGAIDVGGAIKALASEIDLVSKRSVDENDIDLEPQMSPRSTMYAWTYDVSKAVEYAEANYNNTNQQGIFGYYPNVNCQNFGSQCLWAGLGGSGTNTSAEPAVPTQRVGNNVRNVWRNGQSTNYYPDETFFWNHSWVNVRGFFKLIGTSTPSDEGPYGYVTYGHGYHNSKAGDLLAIRWRVWEDGIGWTSPPATDATINHTMFVTEIDPDALWGWQSTHTIKIAAHTGHTNSGREVLAAYLGSAFNNGGQLARAHIWCGWYTIPQP